MEELPTEDLRDFYQGVLDALPLTLAVLDAEGRIVKTNSEWTRFGRENDIDPSYLDPGTNYIDVCRNGNDDFTRQACEGLEEVIRGDAEEFSMEYPCHSDDEKRWFLMKARPLDVEAKPYLLVVHLDITERVVSERKLRHQEKLASIGEMSASIMHEINNPNSFISGNVEYLFKRLEQLPESGSDGKYVNFIEKLEPILEEIQSGSDRITRIVNKVEDFAKEQSAEESETSLDVPRAVLPEVINRLESTHDVEWVDFENKVSDSVTNRSILLSEDEFESVAKNLIDNAIMAVRNAERTDPEVYVELSVEGTVLHLRVLDNGTGIEAKALPKVKDPFFTTKSISEGTGLGLSIVSNLIRKVDGEFDIYSKPGEGTWAFVSVPVVTSN